jgi:nucleotide-binding universal stress UspA family protein
MAHDQSAALHVLWVEEPLPHYASARDEVSAEEQDAARYFEQLKSRATDEADRLGVVAHVDSVRGHAAEGIVEYGQQIGADLIVIGQHGHRGVLDRVLGSTSDRVVDQARSSVLVVPSARTDLG